MQVPRALQDTTIQQQQQQQSLLSSCDLAGIAQYIASGRARNIVVMAGAGISVTAGIPDFRTPGTGLYSQLQRFQLPWPEAVFDIRFFRHNPKPFYLLAKVRRSCQQQCTGSYWRLLDVSST
jgi:NAD-dependent SIR2 family protein deacetylase